MFIKLDLFASLRMILTLGLLTGFLGVSPVRAIEDHSPAYLGVTWYVATTGNDANSCSTAASPCETILSAVYKASTGDMVRVASGTYTGGADITKSIQLSGGWNSGFSAQTGFSIIDSQYTSIGLYITSLTASPIVVDISRFIIQHSYDGGLYVNVATVTLSDSTIRDNRSRYSTGGLGVGNNTTMTLNNVTITGNYSGLFGGGIYAAGEANTLTINNSTIANNFAGLSGGGIYIERGTVNLRNSIVANNTTAGQGATCLGVIANSAHSILGDMTGCTITTGTANQLNTDPLIGAFPIGSPGYHALKPGSPAINGGNPATCLSTDARGVVRPQGGVCDIGAYEYAPSGTAGTFGIISGTPQETGPRTAFRSPFAVYVIDGTGNPVSGATVNFTAPSSGASGTFASSGARIESALTDSTGVAVPSPFIANGQQGTYHVTANVPGLPGSVSFALTNAAWYVAPTGSDTNSCNTSSSPCATIDAAVDKASDGDTVLVAAGTYTPTNDFSPVAWVYKDLALVGGWNSAFTVQDDYSILDGQDTNIGLRVMPDTASGYLFSPALDHFIIQNGTGGLGVRDSNLTIQHTLIANNLGSGLGATNANLAITDSVIFGNGMEDIDGGGINLGTGASLMMENSTMADNTADVGGAIHLDLTPGPGGNAATLVNVTLSGNVAWVAGGVFGSWGYVNLNNVTATNNVATVTEFPNTGGGAIANSGDGSNFIVENSLIAGNFAHYSPDCRGIFTSKGHNLIGTSKGCTIPAAVGDQIGGVNSPINPMLDSLWDNGGLTLTHALQSNSPALDAGNPSTCAPADQRGIARPQGAACDIGAFEAEYTLVNVEVGNSEMGSYPLVLHGSRRQSLPGVNSGPVKITHAVNDPIIAAQRVIYKVDGANTSFSEMMALPDSHLDTTYWLPWYNNKDLDTQLRFANVSSSIAFVHVWIGGTEMTGSPFTLVPGESTRKSFPGVNAGPVKIVSDQNIVAAERVIYKVNGANTSFTEMMALPNGQLDTTHWLPWYNNKDLDTQLRFANVSSQPTSVHVLIGGQEMQGSPFILLPGESTRKSFPEVNAGPVKIVSDQNIVAAERVIYRVNGINTSFSEMMALPDAQLDATYWLPWYNNKDLDTQLRFANVHGSQTATVHIYIGGVEMSGSPFSLAAGESTRKSFAGVNSGPVQIVSNVPIVAAERVIYKVNGVNTSFSEMMALPDSQLDSTYWLPWYNNKDLDTQLRFGVP